MLIPPFRPEFAVSDNNPDGPAAIPLLMLLIDSNYLLVYQVM